MSGPSHRARPVPLARYATRDELGADAAPRPVLWIPFAGLAVGFAQSVAVAVVAGLILRAVWPRR